MKTSLSAAAPRSHIPISAFWSDWCSLTTAFVQCFFSSYTILVSVTVFSGIIHFCIHKKRTFYHDMRTVWNFIYRRYRRVTQLRSTFNDFHSYKLSSFFRTVVVVMVVSLVLFVVVRFFFLLLDQKDVILPVCIDNRFIGYSRT